MNKKITSILLAVMCMFSALHIAVADTTPKVILNDREIFFADQKPVILEKEGRTMVPARGVFEAMGAKVDWDQEKRLVTINNKNGTVRILITIDNPTMVVYTFKDIMSAPEKSEITLDAIPQIMNDRTMIPLRAISESLNADVYWNVDTYTVSIYTEDKKPSGTSGGTSSTEPTQTQAPASDAINLSISASKTAVEAGETFDIIVNVSNLPAYDENSGIAGVSTGIIYDPSKFEYVEESSKYNVGDAAVLKAENSLFKGDCLKVAAVWQDEKACIRKDGELVRFSFKSLTGEGGTFQLSNRYTDRGYDVGLTVRNGDKLMSIDDDLNLDTTPVKVD
ncbi:MAG: stalk domain-containing protein [Clostridia bacterium]|nr:stalk domain-containing protein [Clostridia bacterium]